MKSPEITTKTILEALSDEWQPITSLIFKIEIKEMMDARFLQIKLKELERKGLVLVDVIKSKKNWKLIVPDNIVDRHDVDEYFDAKNKQIKDLLKENPSDLEAWHELAGEYRENSHNELQFCLERIVDLDPFDDEAWLELGHEYFNQEDFQWAIKSYKNAYILALNELEPYFTIVSLNNLGYAYHKNGDYQQAIDSLEKAFKLATEENYISLRKILLRDIGNVFYEDSNYLEAIKYYENALELSTNESGSLFNRDLMFNLGTSYEINKQPEEAIACFEKILEFNSKIDIVWSSLGLVYSAKKEYSKAIKSFEMVLDLNPTDENNKDNLRFALDEMEKNKQSVIEELPHEIQDENVENFLQKNHSLALLKEQNDKFDELIKIMEFSVTINIKSYINDLIKPFFENPSNKKIKKLKKSIEQHIEGWPEDKREEFFNECFRTIKRYEDMQPLKWKKWGSNLLRLISVLR